MEDSKKDLLREALEQKTESWNGLKIHKWTLRQGITNSTELLNIARSLGSSAANIEQLLKTDIGEVIKSSGGDIIDRVVAILAKTIERGNFETYQQAIDFIEGCSMDEVFDLFIVVLRMNVRPLAQKLGDLKEKGLLVGLTKASVQA
jgi:hypothetical protein